jgi:hypothetical protein
MGVIGFGVSTSNIASPLLGFLHKVFGLRSLELSGQAYFSLYPQSVTGVSRVPSNEYPGLDAVTTTTESTGPKNWGLLLRLGGGFR